MSELNLQPKDASATTFRWPWLPLCVCVSLSLPLRVVSGSRDATLRVWDIETGQCLHVLMGHVAAVRCVQYDGRRVVSGAYDFMVKVWDPETETCLHTLQGHTNRVYSLQVSASTSTHIHHFELVFCVPRSSELFQSNDFSIRKFRFYFRKCSLPVFSEYILWCQCVSEHSGASVSLPTLRFSHKQVLVLSTALLLSHSKHAEEQISLDFGRKLSPGLTHGWRFSPIQVYSWSNCSWWSKAPHRTPELKIKKF